MLQTSVTSTNIGERLAREFPGIWRPEICDRRGIEVNCEPTVIENYFGGAGDLTKNRTASCVQENTSERVKASLKFRGRGMNFGMTQPKNPVGHRGETLIFREMVRAAGFEPATSCV